MNDIDDQVNIVMPNVDRIQDAGCRITSDFVRIIIEGAYMAGAFAGARASGDLWRTFNTEEFAAVKRLQR